MTVDVFILALFFYMSNLLWFEINAESIILEHAQCRNIDVAF
jgi:hypothetical protein